MPFFPRPSVPKTLAAEDPTVTGADHDLSYPDDLRKAESAWLGNDREPRVGIALSGGGVRSATFCLGVFQALAQAKLLPAISYVSTVSGGGYFGACLGRLFTPSAVSGGSDGAGSGDRRSGSLTIDTPRSISEADGGAGAGGEPPPKGRHAPGLHVRGARSSAWSAPVL
jgi:hypothetical protein